ncbi:MAG TPA: tRNA (N6-threonylcarbamoyladenosine(37)-N6)-methyltransferase TrmO [Acidimicrobiia bacterium]|jgi:tRNA-Thr(GGU) m(6)t(6)A37 methyltransferase TsaA|nr:tRNA (N6-threonylcarbamoyladenosine(37)-N6)-methyltransferase TrmO [Acidimicrobiia bacterium]
MDEFSVRAVGRVESSVRGRGDAPRQGAEGAPAAWLVLDDGLARAYSDLLVGDRVVVLTWLDRADRSVLEVHPRDDMSAPMRGVFSTRSADRPNPIGLHPVTIVEVDGARIRVEPLEAFDGTPVIDIKPEL